jgi:hypothetical protein
MCSSLPGGHCTLGCFAALAKHERSDVWQLAYLNASNTGRIVALDLKRNLDVLELSLEGLGEGLSFPGLAHLPLKDRDQVLYDRAASAEFFANLFVTDENGDLAVDSGGLTPRRVKTMPIETISVSCGTTPPRRCTSTAQSIPKWATGGQCR